MSADILMQLGVPNLPGMTVTKDKWVFMAQDGFKKKNADSNRPGTAGAEGFRGTGTMKNVHTAEPATRPRSAAQTRVGIGQRQTQPNGGRILGASGSRRTVGFANTTTSTLPEVAGTPPRDKGSPSGSKAGTGTGTNSSFEPHWTNSVLRFYGFFEIVRGWGEGYAPIGGPTLEDRIVRPVTVYHFLQDGTTEIKETTGKNSGMLGGLFYRRGFLERDDDYEGAAVTPADFAVGGRLFVVGREMHLTDADPFTRQWYAENQDVTLIEAMEVPGVYRADLGAQFATGLVSVLGAGTAAKGRVSYNYEEKARIRDKAFNFMNFSECVLNFHCCQLDRDLPPKERTTRRVLSEGRKFMLKYYRGDCHTEIAYIKSEESLRDEPALLLKKTLLEKNWKDVKNGREPIQYLPEDYLVGNIVDVYGRYLLIVDCDEQTRQFYEEELGIKQTQIDVRVIQPPKIVHSIPGKRDGFLTIGSDKDTLATVYGQPKPVIDIDKQQRNAGRLLRCVAQKVGDNGDNVTEIGATYLMTYHLDDDTMSIYVDVARNCGLKAGAYLRRGPYMNELPGDSAVSRLFTPQDIYLGNLVSINGIEFRIVEMDSMSVRFCEGYPDEFPLFDTFTVMRTVLHKVVQRNVDLRIVLRSTDPHMSGFISKEVFFKTLDGLGSMGGLMDQEVMTLLRRFEDRGLYHYNELCDFLAHLHSVTHRTKTPSGMHQVFYYMLRRKQTQWRRVCRRDRTSANGFISLDRLARQMAKHQVPLGHEHRALMGSTYGVPKDTPGTQHVRLPSRKAKSIEKQNFSGGFTKGSAMANTGTSAPGLSIGGGGSTFGGGASVTTGEGAGMDEMSINGQSIATLETVHLPVSPIAVRREHLAQSVFPRKPLVDHELLTQVEHEYQERATVLDYNRFCDDIYRLGWLENGQ